MSAENLSDVCISVEYNTAPYIWVSGVRILTGLISLFVSLFLSVFFIYTRKKKKVTNQNLLFCLAISTLLGSLNDLINRINFYTERPLLDRYCWFAGPVDVYTSLTEYIAVLCISCNLLAQVICRPGGKKLKWIYCSLIFVLPILLCWIPFIKLSYGSLGPWCGIRTLTDDCEPFIFGQILRVLLMGLPVLVLLITIPFLSLTTWLSLRRSLQPRGHSLPHEVTIDKTQVQAELKQLIWCPAVFPFLKLPLLINIIYDTAKPYSPELGLWMAQAIFSPLSAALTILIIAAYTENNARARIGSWITRHLYHREETRQKDGEGGKNRISLYECDVNVSYGDSLSGVIDRNRRERIRKLSSAPSSPTSPSPLIVPPFNK